MKAIVKIDGNAPIELVDMQELARTTERLDRAGVDYDLEFVRA